MLCLHDSISMINPPQLDARKHYSKNPTGFQELVKWYNLWELGNFYEQQVEAGVQSFRLKPPEILWGRLENCR